MRDAEEAKADSATHTGADAVLEARGKAPEPQGPQVPHVLYRPCICIAGVCNASHCSVTQTSLLYSYASDCTVASQAMSCSTRKILAPSACKQDQKSSSHLHKICMLVLAAQITKILDAMLCRRL